MVNQVVRFILIKQMGIPERSRIVPSHVHLDGLYDVPILFVCPSKRLIVTLPNFLRGIAA
jgi:hypothetical protein